MTPTQADAKRSRLLYQLADLHAEFDFADDLAELVRDIKAEDAAMGAARIQEFMAAAAEDEDEYDDDDDDNGDDEDGDYEDGPIEIVTKIAAVLLPLATAAAGPMPDLPEEFSRGQRPPASGHKSPPGEAHRIIDLQPLDEDD